MSDEKENPDPKEKKKGEKGSENPASLSLVDEDGLVRMGSKNKVNLYPEDIIRGLNQIVLEGRGATVCLNYIKKHYKGHLSPPSLPTMHRWVEEVRPILQERNEEDAVRKNKLAALDSDVEDVREQINLLGLDLGKHRNLLEAYLQTMHARIEWLKAVQVNSADPKFEKCLTDDIQACKDIVETILRLEGKLAGDNYTKTALVVFMDHLSPLIGQAYQDTNGTARMAAFVENLKKRFSGLDYRAIHDETVIRMAKEREKAAQTSGE